MSGFPLYDSLNKKNYKKDLTAKQKEEFIRNLNEADDNGTELVYALVQFYFLHNDTTDEVGNTLPYQGTKHEVTKGVFNVTWDFSKFPVKLRQILYNFLQLHIKNLESNSRVA